MSDGDGSEDGSVVNPTVGSYVDLDIAIDNLDRSGGSGSLTSEESFVSNSRIEMRSPNDGRYDTNTTFYFGDNDPYKDSRIEHQLHRDPSDRRSWSDLAAWNDGMWESDRKQQNNDADVYRWIDSFCSSVDCTSTQKNRVGYVIRSASIEQTGSWTMEKIILGSISLVVDSDRNYDRDGFEFDDWIVYDDRFESLMNDIEMSLDELWSIRDMLTSESDFFDE